MRKYNFSFLFFLIFFTFFLAEKNALFALQSNEKLKKNNIFLKKKPKKLKRSASRLNKLKKTKLSSESEKSKTLLKVDSDFNDGLTVDELAYLIDISSFLIDFSIPYNHIFSYMSMYFFPYFVEKLPLDKQEILMKMNKDAKNIDELFFNRYKEKFIHKDFIEKFVHLNKMSIFTTDKYKVFSPDAYQIIIDNGIWNFIMPDSTDEANNKILMSITQEVINIKNKDKIIIQENKKKNRFIDQKIISLQLNKLDERVVDEKELRKILIQSLLQTSLSNLFVSYYLCLLIKNNYISEKDLIHFFNKIFFIENKKSQNAEFDLFQKILFMIPSIIDGIFDLITKYISVFFQEGKEIAWNKFLENYQKNIKILLQSPEKPSFFKKYKKILWGGALLVGTAALAWYKGDSLEQLRKNFSLKDTLYNLMIKSPLDISLEFAGNKISNISEGIFKKRVLPIAGSFLSIMGHNFIRNTVTPYIFDSSFSLANKISGDKLNFMDKSVLSAAPGIVFNKIFKNNIQPLLPFNVIPHCINNSTLIMQKMKIFNNLFALISKFIDIQKEIAQKTVSTVQKVLPTQSQFEGIE